MRGMHYKLTIADGSGPVNRHRVCSGGLFKVLAVSSASAGTSCEAPAGERCRRGDEDAPTEIAQEDRCVLSYLLTIRHMLNRLRAVVGRGIWCYAYGAFPAL